MIEIILPYPNMALSPNRRNGKHRLDGIALTLGINDKQFHQITLRREYRKGDSGMKIVIE